jgi:hypothetical protein
MVTQQHSFQYGQRSHLAVVVTCVQYCTVWCFNCTATPRTQCKLGQITFSFCTILEIVVIVVAVVVVVADTDFVVVGLF